MAKQLQFNEEARRSLKRGVDALAKVVKTTQLEMSQRLGYRVALVDRLDMTGLHEKEGRSDQEGSEQSQR